MFSIIKKEEVPVPTLGFYLEFYVDGNKKVILCENEKHFLSINSPPNWCVNIH